MDMLEKKTLAAVAAVLQDQTSKKELANSSKHQQAGVRSILRSSTLAVYVTPPQREDRPFCYDWLENYGSNLRSNAEEDKHMVQWDTVLPEHTSG